MRRHRLNIIFLTFFPLLLSIGCQQIPPSQMRRFGGNSSQFSQPSQPQVNYQNLFNNTSTQTPSSNTSNNNPAPTVTQPQIEQNSCAQYTSKTENVKRLCQDIVFYYEEDYASVAPNCVRAFNQVAPQSSCTQLVPQLQNMVNQCAPAFRLLSQYASQINGATNCLTAVQSL